MFYAYVVRSIATHHLYNGHCEDLEVRLKQHNSGMTKSVRMHAPVELAYFAEFATREEAIRREKYFKTAAGRRFLKSALDRKVP